MKIRFFITNTSDSIHEFEAFSIANPKLHTYIDARAAVITNDGQVDFKYRELLETIWTDPIAVKINSTTNNRQIDFFIRNAFGALNPIEPSLDINKNPRPRIRWDDGNDLDGTGWDWEYKKKWNPAEWNVADTGEKFPFSLEFFAKIKLNPNQEFMVEFERIKNVKLIDAIITSNLTNKNDD